MRITLKMSDLVRCQFRRIDGEIFEIELLGFPVSASLFDILRTEYRGGVMAKNLMTHVGKTVRMMGDFITAKHVPTTRKEMMNFGTWLHAEGAFFDTTHFPPSLRHSPLNGTEVI